MEYLLGKRNLVIEVRLRKKLGTFLLDAQISDEHFICLTGNNGSGKTSLLHTIAGIYVPDEGFVKVNSKLITDLPMERREVVLVTPESFIPHFEVDKHIVWGAKINGKELSERQVKEVKRALGISFGGKVGKLSLGMKERVSLATALLSIPKVILVDEAFSNLDNRLECIVEYRALTKDLGIDVVFTAQNHEDSKQSDHLYEMQDGKATRVF